MPSTERALARANAAVTRTLVELGTELRERRLALGVSQEIVAAATRISRPRISGIEAGTITTLSVTDLHRLATVLGLEASVRLYAGGTPIRDAAHSGKLGTFLAQVHRPLVARVEVPLPSNPDRWERRAWDAVLFGRGERTAIELEMRLRDVQATRRRHELKRRDDPTEAFLLLIADTRHNRRVLAGVAEVFADLPRLRPSAVAASLEAARHPPTGLLLV
jgi:transcriptional regulator with XRE-family HTH domain